MINRRFTRRNAARLFAAVCSIVALSANAGAQTITYVSAVGNDANPCNVITAPCKTLQRGINTVLAGGEVRVLTPLQSNGFVSKSLSISGDGVVIVGTIIVNSASAVVTLRGLVLDGINGFANGVKIEDAAGVQIQGCTIERYTGVGILVDFTDAEVFVTDTISRNNQNDGLAVNGNSTTAELTVDNSRFENNGGDGLDVDGIESTITRVVTSGNGGDGIEVNGGRMNVTDTSAANNGSSGFNVSVSGQMTLESVVARGNTVAGIVVAAGSSIARISNSVFSNNATGIDADGTVLTRQNNVVSGNTTNVSGTLTPLAGI
jgi:hypothetical protein